MAGERAAPPPAPGCSRRIARSESAVEVATARPAAGNDGWTQHIAPGIYQVVPPWSYHSGRPIDQKSTVAGQGIFNIDGGLAKRSPGAFSPTRGKEMRAESTKQEHWKAAALTTRSGAPLQLTFKRSSGQCAPEESMMTAATTIPAMIPEPAVLLGRDRLPGQGIGRGELLARLHSHGMKHDLDHPLAPRKGAGLCSPLRTRQEVGRVEFKPEFSDSGFGCEKSHGSAMIATAPTGEDSAKLAPSGSVPSVRFASSEPKPSLEMGTGTGTGSDDAASTPAPAPAKGSSDSDRKVVPSKVIKAEQVSSAADLHRMQQQEQQARSAAATVRAAPARARSPAAATSEQGIRRGSLSPAPQGEGSVRSPSAGVRVALQPQPQPSPAAERAISASAVIGRWQGSASCADYHRSISGDATFAAGPAAPRALEMHRADLSKDVDGMMRRGLGTCRHNGNVSLQLSPPERKANSTIIDAVAAEVRGVLAVVSAPRAGSPGYSPPRGRRGQTADGRVLAWDALPASPGASPPRHIATRHILGSRSPSTRNLESKGPENVMSYFCGSPLESAAARSLSPPLKEVPIFDRKCAGVFSPIRPAGETPWTAAPMPQERCPSRVAHPSSTRAPTRSTWREDKFVYAQFIAKEAATAAEQEHSPDPPAGLHSRKSPSPTYHTTANNLTRPIRSASAAVGSTGDGSNSASAAIRSSNSVSDRRRISYASEYEDEVVQVESAKYVAPLTAETATLPAAPSHSSKPAGPMQSSASTAAPPSVSSPLQTMASNTSRRRSPSPPIGPVVMSDGMGLGGTAHTSSRASTAATTGLLSRGSSGAIVGAAAAAGASAGAGAGPPISSSAKMAATLSAKSGGSITGSAGQKTPTSSRVASVNGHAPHSLFGTQAARTAPRQNPSSRASSRQTQRS